MEKDLTKGNVFKTLMLFTLPILLANLLQALYGTVDMIIVGAFSTSECVSAVSTGTVTMQTIMAIVTGMAVGSTVLIGQSVGKKDLAKATKAYSSSILLFIILGLLMSLIVPFLANPIALIMNAPVEAFDQTVDYVFVCGIGMIFVVLFNAISAIFRGVGDSKTPLILMLIATVVNIILDLVFVGALELNAFGAALATILAQAVSVISSFIILKKKGLGFAMEKEHNKPHKKEILEVLKYGTPVAAQEALTGVSFMIILSILNSFGLIASAGVGIAEKLCGLIFIVPGALMSSISAFSAQNIAAKEDKRAIEGMKLGMITSVLFGLVVFAITFFGGFYLSRLFSNDADVCLASASYLKSYSIDCVIVGINFAMMGYLSGKGKTLFVSIQGILSTFLVRIPVCYFVSKIPNISLFWVGFATPAATIFAIIITTIYMLIIRKQDTQDNKQDNK